MSARLVDKEEMNMKGGEVLEVEGALKTTKTSFHT